MNTHTQSSQDHKSRASANRTGNSRRGDAAPITGGRDSLLARQRLGDALIDSPNIQALTQLQQTMNQSPRIAAQAKLAEALQSDSPPPPATQFQNGRGAEESLQGKFGSVRQRHSPTVCRSASAQAVVQRRVAIKGYTIVTPENQSEIDAYIASKQLLAQEEEKKRAERSQTEPQVVKPLKPLSIRDVIPFIIAYYKRFSPPCDFEELLSKLYEWANAKGPSEVQPDETGLLPLVSTQDNSFESVEQLFFALVQNIRAKSGRERDEHASFEILGNLDFYLPTLIRILGSIREQMQMLQESRQLAIVQAGYAGSVLGSSREIDPVALVLAQEGSLRKLYIAVNTIHSFAVETGFLARSERASISREMGSRRNKYSPVGAKVEEARRLGYSIWSGFSGSTADILNLARHYRLPPDDIRNLAAATAAFFQFLPTSKNPTHTFHEVMLVANRYFDVPYDPKNPLKTLPHRGIEESTTVREPVNRVGKYGQDVKEVSIDRLIALHNVPRLGVSETNITDIRDRIKEEGFNLKYPVSVTLFPNNDYLVTGGHHRIAAMKMLGEHTVPVKVFRSVSSDPLFMAKMVGIARITGKYFDRYDPGLDIGQLHSVNAYLRSWVEANTDQVHYPFQYKTLPLSKL